MKRIGRTSVLASCLLALAPAVACSTDGHIRADDTATRMTSLREALLGTKRQASVAIGSLDGVIQGRGGDAKLGYEKYARDVAITEDAIKSVDKRYEAVRSEAKKYFEEWEKQLGDIGSDEIRKRSEERRAAQVQQIERIDRAMVDAREALTPFVNRLRDTRIYLATDLSSAGLQSLRPVFDQLSKENVLLDRKLDSVVTAVDDVAPGFRAEAPQE